MVKEILTGAGFVENKTFKETRFLKPPKETYAIYTDSFTSRGADNRNLVREHEYTIEMYSSKKDPESEAKIESMLDTLGIEYDKDPCCWINEEQLYQTVYLFNYNEKL